MPVRRGPNPVPDEESIMSPPGNCEGFIFSREGKHNSLKGEKTCGVNAVRQRGWRSP